MVCNVCVLMYYYLFCSVPFYNEHYAESTSYSKIPVVDTYDGEITTRNDPKDSRMLCVKIKSRKAMEMMNALNDLFYDVQRHWHSHFVKVGISKPGTYLPLKSSTTEV